ncbi:MAG: hypothetical protein NVS3B25_22670 [Hymenobacter sp.]
MLVPGRVVAAPAPLYSNTNQYFGYAPYQQTLLGIESGVQYPERAADADLSNFATLNTAIGIASTTTLGLGLGGTAEAGERAGILVGNVASNNLLNLNALGTITLRTYTASNQLQETRVVSAEVARGILLSGDRPTGLEFVANIPFSKIELVVGGVATASYKLKVYYAYAVASLVQPQVRGQLSQFAGTGSQLLPYYRAGTATTGVVSACVDAGVTNPERAVDQDLTNYAQFNSLATVSCPSALAVKLAGSQPAPAGYYAGFVIGSAGLLDLGVLAGLRISTYLNGVPTGESATGAGVLELHPLPNGKSQVSFPTTLPFDEVKIERVGVLTALDNLQLYYGFGVEPRAFQGTTHVLSDFDPSQTAGKYEVKANAVVCVSYCGVTNPQGAADNDPSTFAVVTLPTAALANVELKLVLNGAGTAGNRAGMVVGNGQNLLDASVLDRLTLTTYDAAGNVLESASGRAALALNLRSDGRQDLSFLTTRPFASVQLSVTAGAAALTSFPVHYAFADDRPGGLPALIVPLPVELTAFSGRWTNGVAELSWATATEHNSSHFVVERSAGPDAAFRAVGQVAAAGTSTSPRAYSLRDAEAVHQDAAVLYYRLRQVDTDGRQAFSPVVAVAVSKASAAPQLDVYPNPTPEGQAVRLRCANLPATGGTLQAYSQLGQLVRQLPVPTSATYLLPPLGPGLYHLVLRDIAGRPLATQRLVVGGR